MNWEQLLSLNRHGDQAIRLRSEQDQLRLGFEVDYDRIIFSSAFRSLQDKTQVIPFSKTDFVHTRLTHSLEVSVVGRSLGRMVGHTLLTRHPELQSLGYQATDFGSIVATACLAHDIGNPPFGHSGEKAIGTFFSSGPGQEYKTLFTPEQYADLCAFEGNANGLKTLCQSTAGSPGGFRLSYATLGAFIKYPKASLPHKPTAHIADKKFGFFQTEAAFFKELTQALGMAQNGEVQRHPLAYLVEAADDICYTIIDFEDGINLGWISEAYALEYLINLVRDRLDTQKYSQLTDRPQRLSYLRALAINSLIQDAAQQFLDHEEALLQGTYPHALLDKSKYSAQIKDIIDLSIQKVYRSEEVIQKEIVGYRVLSTLLGAIVPAAHRHFENQATAFDRLVLALVPEGVPLLAPSLYETVLNATCFVASLSDSKAMEWAQQLK
ncbi:MAG: dGTP triphosphohydrolase [Flavobacteriaceae bacterium]